MSSSRLDGSVALVTGASRGIGQAIARSLADAGAKVVGTATGESGVAAIDAALGGRGRGAALDVNAEGAVEALVADIEKREGAVTILVNNAAVTKDNLLLRMKDDEWESVIDTDLRSVFRLSRAAMRGMMKARHGRIVNITSVVGASGNPGQVNYAAAKAGIGGFTRSLAQEIGSRGITVNCIAPGFIDTDMTRALPEATRSALLAKIPLGRLGAAEDVAAAVLFLASPEAGYITGVTLHVNGGMYMT
jgi:3-oxoacyl-[acyl-carrier protein] reductase